MRASARTRSSRLGSGCAEDKGRGLRMLGGEFGCEGGADAGAEEDDPGGREVAGGGEVLPGEGGVLLHAALVGVEGGALAVATVVEGEDVDAGGVEGGEGDGSVGVGEGAVAAGEVEDGGGRVRLPGAAASHHPVSWGVADSSMPKWTGMTGVPAMAAGAEVEREGCRTSCHCP